MAPVAIGIIASEPIALAQTPKGAGKMLPAPPVPAGVRVRLNPVKVGGHGAGFGGAELEKMRRDFWDHHLKGANNDAARWPVAMRSSTEAVAAGAAKQKGKAGARK